MDRSEFREALLAVMEKKVHWAWPGFTSGLVPRERLHIHLEQEYAVYVRDFPVLVARAYVACPFAAARRELISNVYEEETGGLAAGRPHPELFLEYPRGLGMDLSRFAEIELLPAARHLRDIIDRATLARGWEAAAAVTTLFLEGTANERQELEPGARKSPPSLEEHPLVRHYGLPIEHLALTKAHRSVEGDHRRAAWTVILDYVGEPARAGVLETMSQTLTAWQAYRDEVAMACGLVLDPNGEPRAATLGQGR
jgi:pyrroloquinoline-quinone synthase